MFENMLGGLGRFGGGGGLPFGRPSGFGNPFGFQSRPRLVEGGPSFYMPPSFGMQFPSAMGPMGFGGFGGMGGMGGFQPGMMPLMSQFGRFARPMPEPQPQPQPQPSFDPEMLKGIFQNLFEQFNRVREQQQPPQPAEQPDYLSQIQDLERQLEELRSGQQEPDVGTGQGFDPEEGVGEELILPPTPTPAPTPAPILPPEQPPEAEVFDEFRDGVRPTEIFTPDGQIIGPAGSSEDLGSPLPGYVPISEREDIFGAGKKFDPSNLPEGFSFDAPSGGMYTTVMPRPGMVYAYGPDGQRIQVPSGEAGVGSGVGAGVESGDISGQPLRELLPPNEGGPMPILGPRPPIRGGNDFLPEPPVEPIMRPMPMPIDQGPIPILPPEPPSNRPPRLPVEPIMRPMPMPPVEPTPPMVPPPVRNDIGSGGIIPFPPEGGVDKNLAGRDLRIPKIPPQIGGPSREVPIRIPPNIGGKPGFGEILPLVPGGGSVGVPGERPMPILPPAEPIMRPRPVMPPIPMKPMPIVPRPPVVDRRTPAVEPRVEQLMMRQDSIMRNDVGGGGRVSTMPVIPRGGFPRFPR